MKEGVSIQSFEKVLDFCLAVLDDMDFLRDDEGPQVHEAIDCGIHRNEIGVHDRNRNFSNMRTGSPAEKRRLRIAEIFLGKIRLTLKNGLDSHPPQVSLAD